MPLHPSAAPRHADLLALGFGTTVAMWSIGYFCRLFGNAVPPAVIFTLLVLCQLIAGYLAGRYTDRGILRGVQAGLLTGVLNLLIVGSLMGGDTPNAVKTGALLWIPGTLVIGAVLGALGAASAAAIGRSHKVLDWPGIFAGIAAVATFVLLAVGGLVTGFDEGLAVVDWPNTEGYNMFLYPLARMTGGVYLEHAHRLFGSLVGLIVLVLAIHTQATEPRGRIRVLTWTALAFVVIQGILGGLRVTGRLTLSTDPEDTAPNVILAIIHGVFGQVVFGTLVAVALFRSRAWHHAAPPTIARTASTDRFFTYALGVLLIVQLVLGALVRHFTWALALPEMRYGLDVPPDKLADHGTWALHLHITLAVVVILLAIGVGVRAWGLYRHMPRLPGLGKSLLVLAGVQLALGLAALIASANDDPTRRPGAIDVAITTAHQVVGAALLAWTVMLLVWDYRLLRDPPRS